MKSCGMHFHCYIAAAAISLSALSESSKAAEFTGYLTLSSDYVKRGITQSEGDPVVQIGGDLSFPNGVFIGAWGSTVDIPTGANRQRDVETNYYAGYTKSVTDTWQLSLHAVAYRYPGQSGDIDYSYEEYSVSGSYRDRLWIEYSYSPDLFNTDRSAQNVDLFLEWPLSSRWSVSGGAGRYDTSNLSGGAYTYWQTGVTGAFRWADIDLRYHEAGRWVPFISSPERSKSRLVLAIQIPLPF